MTVDTTRYPVPLMAVPETPAQPPRWAVRLGRSLRAARRGTAAVVGANVPAALRHLTEHAYALLGLGSLSAAGYVHSTFTGLLATGACFLVFEFKLNAEGEDE